jgi:predicted dehydrogenase
VVVGQVGCGLWGANVLRDLRTLGCEVRVVARSEASIARARDGGASSIVSQISDFGPVDAVVVVTPIATHARVVESALALDVPVFVEKPLCDDLEDAARLAALAPERLFVMDKWRYHPGIARLAEFARSGSLGRVHGLRTVRVQPENRHEEDCVWVLAPHDLAIALEVLGEIPRPTAARGRWDGVKLVTLFGLLETGAAWHALEVSERAPATERRIELHCEDGIAVLGGGWDEQVVVHRAARAPEQIEARGELPLLAELRAFIGFVDGGSPPKSSAEEGRDVVESTATLRTLAS